ncbi:MAG TPA: SMC-Scp complex subunit ScpB [Actinomycetota bacterium]|nr:SMC-Scp complex subunit ScpB [Actinomycetota bacterium]
MSGADLEVVRAIEAILFVAEEPIPAAELALVLELPTERVETLLASIGEQLESEGRGFILRRVGGGYRLATHPAAHPFLERFVTESQAPRLTQAALETLAVIAYRQPASRAQIAEIRGVSSDSALRTLVTRGLVAEVGRDPGPGSAILYGTTPAFLERFGLMALSDLPPLTGFLPTMDDVERMEAGLGPGV